MKPYLVLDVDEVLQASELSYAGDETTVIVQEAHSWESLHESRIPKECSRIPGELVQFNTSVRTSRALLSDLAALPAQHVFLTGWLENDSIREFLRAHEVTELFSSALLLQFPGRQAGGSLPWDWKLREFEKLLRASPRPFIWADDDEALKWPEYLERTYPELPRLLIAPERGRGLTKVHMNEMKDFLSA